MKVFIPYRLNSSRCKRKNVKEFYDGKSLLDLTLDQFSNHQVILASVPCQETQDIAKRHNVRTIDLCPDEPEGFSGVLTDMAKKAGFHVHDDEPMMTWFCTEITYFLNHTAQEFIDFGLSAIESEGFDSTVMVRPFKHFLMDDNFQPENYSMGGFFNQSQQIKQKYWAIPGIALTTRKNMLKYRWCNGPNYKPFIAHPLYVDIDEQFEFELAQSMWKSKKGK